MTASFSDLHGHTTLFSYNRRYRDPWFEWYFPIFPAQGDFCQLARGKVRVVMASLYPVEQGFVTMKPLNLGTGGLTDLLAKIIVDFPKERSDEIQAYDHDYFDDLIKELNYMQGSAEPVTHRVFITPFKRKKFSYRIVRDFNDLKDYLHLDAGLNSDPAFDDTIAVVLTIEGAHSLGVGQKNTKNLSDTDLENLLRINIAKLKNLGPPGQEGAWCPFFITLSHHFWNQLGGHAVSLWKIIRKTLDQTYGINEDIKDPGRFVVDQLLDNSNGQRRILIDCAHMSMKVRRWYFNYLEQRGDNIPVFVSHTGVNSKATMADAEMQGTPETIHDVADDLYDNSTEFNPWDVFISDEEIMIIHRSDGIIGLNMDQRIMMGKQQLDAIKKQVIFKSVEKKREIWIKPLLEEILHIAGLILRETGQPDKIWDNISIGSDYNGMITPIHAFRNAEKFPLLQETMIKELKKLVPSEITLSGKTDADIEEITNKILWKNNLLFLQKYFR